MVLLFQYFPHLFIGAAKYFLQEDPRVTTLKKEITSYNEAIPRFESSKFLVKDRIGLGKF